MTPKNSELAYHLARSERFLRELFVMKNIYTGTLIYFPFDLITSKESTLKRTAHGYLSLHASQPRVAITVKQDTGNEYTIKGKYGGRFIGHHYDPRLKTFDILGIILICPTNKEETAGPILIFDSTKVTQILMT